MALIFVICLNDGSKDGVNIVYDFILLTLALATIITLFSLFSKRIETRIIYPIVFSAISILIFFISVVFGGWEGMGLGVFSISLLVGSAISFIVIVLLYKLRS